MINNSCLSRHRGTVNGEYHHIATSHFVHHAMSHHHSWTVLMRRAGPVASQPRPPREPYAGRHCFCLERAEWPAMAAGLSLRLAAAGRAAHWHPLAVAAHAPLHQRKAARDAALRHLPGGRVMDLCCCCHTMYIVIVASQSNASIII